MSLPKRIAAVYADAVVKRPVAFLSALVVLALLSGWASTHLKINSNQLDLISQDLQEVKDARRVIDMVGGAGYFIVALRSESSIAEEPAA